MLKHFLNLPVQFTPLDPGTEYDERLPNYVEGR